MALNDIGKLWVLLLALAGAILLRAIGAIDDVVFIGVVGPVIGYVTGNGRLAVRHEAPSPILVPKLPEELLDHHDVDQGDNEA